MSAKQNAEQPIQKKIKVEEEESSEGIAAQSMKEEDVFDPVPTMKLESNDDVVVEVPIKSMFLSVFIKGMFENTLIPYDRSLVEPIRIAKLNGKTLQLVVDWCNHHCNNPDPPDASAAYTAASTSDSIVMPAWDLDFFGRMDQETVFNMIHAANFLDIEMMIDLGCKTIANRIKGKTTEELREEFDIANDWAIGEQEAFCRQYYWMDEIAKFPDCPEPPPS